MTASLLLATACALQVNENLTIYSLIPPEAEQGWKLELFRLAEPIAPHYHRLQRQLILVTEGKVNAFYDNEKSVILQSSELTHVDPGIVHSLIPEGTAYFFSIDFPGFHFPEDVFYDESLTKLPWIPPNAKFLPPLDPKYFGIKLDLGNYAVYELLTGHMTQQQWSLALLEIQDSQDIFIELKKSYSLLSEENWI